MPLKVGKVVSKPVEGKKRVMVTQSTGPAITGGGSDTYVCGSCGTTLAKSVERGQVHDTVIQCHECGNYNELD
jgi:predicted RNA-binding Zn-ribbon protein involved in translation (DUF1610 family)